MSNREPSGESRLKVLQINQRTSTCHQLQATAMATTGTLSRLSDPRFVSAYLGSLLVIPWLFAFYRPANNGLDISGYQIGHDFINVWAAPQLAFDGKLATLFDFDAYHHAIGQLFGHPIPFHSWSYPIFDLLLFWPFAKLPYFWALAIWTVGLFAIFAAITLSGIARQDRLRALVLLVIAPACLINVVSGQNGFLSAALLIGGVLLIDRRPVLSGILFGLLAFKPHLGIVLPFALLMLRAWRVIGAAALTSLVLVGASLAIFGIEPWRQYFEVTGPSQLDLLDDFSGYYYYTYMMVSVAAGARKLGLPYPIALVVQLIVAIAIVTAASWAVVRTNDPHTRAFVLVSAALLVTPYAFSYDLAALAAVLTWKLFGENLHNLKIGPRVIFVLGWVIPILAMYLSVIGFGIAPLILVAIFVFAVHDALDNRSPPPAVKIKSAV